MLASKPKPAAKLSEASNHKEASNRRATSAPRVGRPVKPAAGGAGPSNTSPLHRACIPLDKSIDLPTKPLPGAGERRSFKAAAARTSSEKQPRTAKTSELQAQLDLVQEDLKNARGHLASIEQDKAQAFEDLALAKMLADDAHGKLEESLVAQRRAEEALELEKFKSTEREQSSIEMAHKMEEEWRRKYDNVKKRHAEDVASLIAVARELESVKDELAATVQAKNSALSHADEVQKIANDNAKKVEILMAELARLKSHHGTELEIKAKEATEIIKKLEREASELRAELHKAKAFAEKLVKAEELVEGLKVDIAYAKRAEVDANQSAQEWKKKAESLETRLEEVSLLNKCNEESLASLTNSFEDCTSMLQDKQSQVLHLKEKVASLEKEASGYKDGFLETSMQLDKASKEASELEETIDRLKSEHQLLHEAHQQIVVTEKTASAQVSHLTEDKKKLLQELDNTREERDNVKKAVGDLAAALREVSSEAREAKERVLAKQAELDNAQLQISELKEAMKNAEDRHQLMLDESNYETACLRKTVEKMGSEVKASKDGWISKEAGFVDMLKRSDDGMSSINTEMNRLTESQRIAEKEVQELKADKTQLLNKLQEFEFKAINTSSRAEEAMAESSQLKDRLSFKEKEVLSLNHEVTDLRLREQAALEKANELSKLFAEVTARKAEEEEAAKNTEKSKSLVTKLEMDKVLESLKAAECEAKAAKDDKVQLHNKLRLLESKITEANLISEEAKITSLRLKEMLEDKDNELASIAQENNDMRAREAAAQAKIDELATQLAEATARKGGGLNGVVAARSPEKQPSVLLKLMCSPMHNVRDDEPCKNSDQSIQMEDIKHVEVEIVKQVKHEKESVSAVDANSLENSKIIEDDLAKERDDDSESSDDDIESPGDDGLVDQMNGLLIHGPTSSFNQEEHIHKKKKALLKKFGSLLKKKAHFTKLSNHS
ncbi:WEB family protein At3g02930, chloroplastic-like [Phragmites australis]|uniref:WEB family protein At3g02930, chloroplastic-like n=1 Tax=Phragmites australis TaxID=29695 RepID=UPI002D7A09CA|nr:WEB family protein At3g02930, chloroplastic-like [Phragmites australis]